MFLSAFRGIKCTEGYTSCALPMSGAKIVLTMPLIKGILCSNMSSLDWYNCGEPDLTFGALSRRDIVYMNEHH